MRRRIWKLYVNFENEEKWINEMAAKGLNLIDYHLGRYLFEEGTPGEYIYRIELLNNLPSHPETREYIRFMEGTGIECVATYFRWAFFRKKASEGEFNLYSDYDSRIKYYKKLTAFLGVVCCANLLPAISNLFIGLSTGNDGGTYANAYISTANWLIVFILGPLVIKYLRTIRKMKKEKQLYE